MRQEPECNFITAKQASVLAFTQRKLEAHIRLGKKLLARAKKSEALLKQIKELVHFADSEVQICNCVPCQIHRLLESK